MLRSVSAYVSHRSFLTGSLNKKGARVGIGCDAMIPLPTLLIYYSPMFMFTMVDDRITYTLPMPMYRLGNLYLQTTA